MAGRKRSGPKPPPRPACAGSNKDLSSCIYKALEGELYCARHLPRPTHEATAPVAVHEADSDATQEPPAAQDLMSGLQHLRGNAAPIVVKTWLDAAENSTRLMTFSCECGKRNRVQVPDYGARLKATELIVTHSVGKPGSVGAGETAPIDIDVNVSKLRLEERKRLKAALLARLGPEYVNELRKEAGLASE